MEEVKQLSIKLHLLETVIVPCLCIGVNLRRYVESSKAGANAVIAAQIDFQFGGFNSTSNGININRELSVCLLATFHFEEAVDDGNDNKDNDDDNNIDNVDDIVENKITSQNENDGEQHFFCRDYLLNEMLFSFNKFSTLRK